MTQTSGPGEMTLTSGPGEMTQTSGTGQKDKTHTVGLRKRFTVSESAGNKARVGGAERAFALGSAVKRDGWMTATAC